MNTTVSLAGPGRKALAALGLGATLALAPAVMPTTGGPAVLQPVAAQASTMDCVVVAQRVYQITGGNLGAAISAFRHTTGCGNTLADTVCRESRKPSGGFYRWIIQMITGGKYSTC